MSSLTDEQFIRYSKHICLHEWGEKSQIRLLDSSVLVIGCGGLGNHVAISLAASGVGRLVLVDDDQVELNNLPRQISFNMAQVGVAKVDALKATMESQNADCRVRCIKRRMTDEQLMLEVTLADIVIDCSDNMPTRQQINQCCYRCKVPLISGAVTGWEGQFSIWDYAPEQACYSCLFPETSQVQTVTNNCADLGVVAPVVGIIGYYQSLACLQLLTHQEISFSRNRLYRLDGKLGDWSEYSIIADPQCAVCREQRVNEEDTHIRLKLDRLSGGKEDD